MHPFREILDGLWANPKWLSATVEEFALMLGSFVFCGDVEI